MTKTNPNKANQYRPDPRQSLFLSYYYDPESPTFSNALQSALKAGYSQESAENILSQDLKWLSESTEEKELQELLSISKKRLKEIAELSYVETVRTQEGEMLDKVNPAILKVVQDTVKFGADRLDKKNFSTRQEHTGSDGQPLNITIQPELDEE